MENKPLHDKPPGEIVYSLETMTVNRKNVMDIFNFLKSKYLGGTFTVNELIHDKIYSSKEAHMMLDTLARNGLLNGELNNNPNFNRYSFVNNKQKQIENIKLWYDRSKLEMQFFEMAIQVIENEVKESETSLKIV